MSLGRNIQAAIQAQDRRQADVARLAGIEPQTLHALIKRDSSKTEYLPEIARALYVRPDDLTQSREHAVASARAALAKRLEVQESQPTYGKGEMSSSRDFAPLLAVVKRLSSDRAERLLEMALDLLEEQTASEDVVKKGAA